MCVMDLVQIMDVNLEVTFILMFEDLYRENIPDFLRGSVKNALN